MEFTDSYTYKPDVVFRLSQNDMERVLRSRATHEATAVQMLADALPELRKRASHDTYSHIEIRAGGEPQRGWIIASFRDTAPNAKPTSTITVAMNDEGELWRGAFDSSARVLEVTSDSRPYSVPGLAWQHRVYAEQISAPLVSNHEDEIIAATLQRVDNGLNTTLDFLLNPRTIR